jgi:hypothetical protein
MVRASLPTVAQTPKYLLNFTKSNALLTAPFETKPYHTLQSINNMAGHKMEGEITDTAILCCNIGEFFRVETACSFIQLENDRLPCGYN